MKPLHLTTGKLYKTLNYITSIEPRYSVIPKSSFVLLIDVEEKSSPTPYTPGKCLTFLFGKQIIKANFSSNQLPSYLECLT